MTAYEPRITTPAKSGLFALERYAVAPFVREDRWLALFLFLVLTQSAHLLEHFAQIVQIHLLGLKGAQAQGIVGQLNIEWVHFGWNAFVIGAVALLLFRYKSSRWLWAAAVLASWHMLEHAVIITNYLHTGQPGTPGLLSQGGLIAGGLPLARPDLHFLYNLVETLPLYFAYVALIRAMSIVGQGARDDRTLA
jgi:hypothetical protein